MKTLTENDKRIWDAFVQNVTPLGQPSPSTPPIPVPIIKSDNQNKLDLHGLTLNEAFLTTKEFIQTAVSNNKSITIITGMSGDIKREFPYWMENNHLVSSIEEMNGGGAYKIFFKKRK